jgi:hypothetical protein
MLVKGIRQTERINDGRMVEKSGKDTGTGGATLTHITSDRHTLAPPVPVSFPDFSTIRPSFILSAVGSRRGSPLDAWFRWNDTVEQMLVKGIRQTERTVSFPDFSTIRPSFILSVCRIPFTNICSTVSFHRNLRWMLGFGGMIPLSRC